MKKQTTIILITILSLSVSVLSGIAQEKRDNFFQQQIERSKQKVNFPASTVTVDAAAPANDNFANALPLVLNNGSVGVSTNNIDATKEAGEPSHAENTGGKSVWFSFTPQTTTVIRINTVDTTFDTLLAVYSGTSVNNLTRHAYNDDCHNTCGRASTVDMMVAGGETYYIAVDGYSDGNGAEAGNFKVVILDAGAPPQDNLAGAYDLGTGQAGSITGTNYNATIEPNEPTAYTGANPNGKSVWYRWTPGYSYSIAFEISENFDSQIGVYTSDAVSPTLAQLTKVTSNIDYSGFTSARYRTTFFAEANRTYFIKIDWHTFNNGQFPTGNFQLRFFPNRLRYSTNFSGFSQKTSISVYRPAEGAWYNLINLPDLSPFYRKWGLENDLPVPADYNGDGTSEIAVVRNENGQKVWYVSNGASFLKNVAPWGLATDKALTGDFDGDGRADLVAIRNNGQNLVWYVRQSSDLALRIFTFGINFDKPVVGDFDGDGLTDVAVVRNTQQGWVWHVLQSDWGTYDRYFSAQFGAAPDVPTVEDYDGDGKSDLSVWRPSTGVWYTLQSGNGEVQVAQFGSTGDRPQPGDYNGDGRADFAVFRPSNGTWYIAKPTGIPSQNFHAIPWGTATDIPASSLAALSQ